MTRKKQKTLEEKIEQVKNFRPIDDTLFLKYWQMILAYVRRCCVSF